jgi:hypothetical protein
MFERICFIRGVCQQGGFFRLSQILEFSKGCQAEDKRDRVYALLGMTEDADDPDLHISYSEPFSLVFERVARFLVRKADPMAVLYHPTNRFVSDAIPSWIPDWTSPILYSSLELQSDPQGERLYKTSGSSKCRIAFGSDRRDLVVSGGFVDQIRKTGVGDLHRGTRQDAVPDEEYWEFLKQWLEEAQEMINDLDTYPTGEHVYNAYWRTLIADIGPPKQRTSTPEFYNAFLVWRSRLIGIHAVDTDILGDDEITKFRKFDMMTRMTILGRRFGLSHAGYMCLLPAHAEEGDHIVVVLGGHTPLLLRRKGDCYSIVGDCYVHGLMDGQALGLKGFKIEDIILR